MRWLGVTTAERDEGECDDPAPEVDRLLLQSLGSFPQVNRDQPRHLAVLSCIDPGLLQRAFIPVAQRNVDDEGDVEELAFCYGPHGAVFTVVNRSGNKALAEDAN